MGEGVEKKLLTNALPCSIIKILIEKKKVIKTH